jgi:hypothetical protein
MTQSFNYLIPVRVFMENGGNIMTQEIITSHNLFDEKFKVETREKNTLNLVNEDKKIKSHVDCCWVIAKVLL